MARRLFLLLLILILPLAANADGKMFGRVVNPGEPGIRQQRALISWRGGVQTLIVENSVENAQDAAWLLPIPGKPIEMEQLPDAYFTVLSAGNRVRMEQAFLVVIAVIVFILLLIGAWSGAAAGTAKGYVRATIIVFLFCALPCFFLYPVFGGGRIELDRSRFDFQPVGDYDLAVIAPDKSDAGITWLRKNKFAVSPVEAAVLKSYAERGWHFVAARIRSASGEVRPRPLMIKCPSDAPVYPMTLTALQGGPLDLELYVVGPGFARVPGMDMIAQRSIYWTTEDQKHPVFPEDYKVSRLLGRFQLGAKTDEIRPTFDGTGDVTVKFQTPASRTGRIFERVFLAGSAGLILIPGFLIRRRGYWRAIMIGGGIGLFAGLLWSIPIHRTRTVDSVGPRLHYSGVLSESRRAESAVLNMMREKNPEDALEYFEWSSKQGHPSRLKFSALTRIEETENGLKGIVTSSNGEPVIYQKTWKP